MIISFRYRVKDGSYGKFLSMYAIACNRVWNFCVATQREAERRLSAGCNVRWPSAFDLIKLCTSSAAELGLHSDTVQAICRQFATSRDTHKKCPKFRASFGAKRSLGWVPFTNRAIKLDGDAVVYLKRRFRFWKSREVEGDIKSGSFVQDARGRWYVVLQCEVQNNLPCGNGEVGIDLGLKSLATCSDGAVIEAPRLYRKRQGELARAQRSGNKKRVRAIHAKIKNARKHFLHVASTKLADANSLIVVGDVSSSKLAKTRMAKSVLDAGWSSFKAMLRYKSARRQAVYVEVNERYTSQTCSCCGVIPSSSPKGMSAIGVRSWDCSECGASHDRDVNAALNILRIGLERQAPSAEILAL